MRSPFASAEAARPHVPDEVVSLDDPDHYSGTHRIAGLADGVFAIAMTLLALTLIEHLPPGALSLAEFEHHFGVPLLVYGMTFIILGTYWVSHAIQMHYVVRADRPLMVRTVLFLIFVSLVPFSTGYLGTTARFLDPLAIALYCANLALCGFALQRTLLYATLDPHMLHRVFDKRIFRALHVSFLIGPALYVVAGAVAWSVSPRVAFAMCVVVPVFTFFPNPFWGKLYARIVTDRKAA